MTSTPPSFFTGKSTKNLRFRRRAGVSPVIATTMILAITIALGLALYSFSLSQTNTSTQSFAQEATDYINYRNDRFVVTNISFNTDKCGVGNSNCVTTYVFNNGNLPVTISGVMFGEGLSSLGAYCIHLQNPPAGQSQDDALNTVTISPGTLTDVSIDTDNGACGSTLSLVDDHVYQAKLISKTGSYQETFQKNAS